MFPFLIGIHNLFNPIRNWNYYRIIKIFSSFTAIKPHGLSETIALVWKDANVYALRKGIGKRNMAVPEDRPEPGTIQIVGKRKIICAFAQVAMGKPGM